jgi:hypothetical protein
MLINCAAGRRASGHDEGPGHRVKKSITKSRSEKLISRPRNRRPASLDQRLAGGRPAPPLYAPGGGIVRMF